jgi:ribosomal protein S18 acetylase RimI-like enzyme
MPAYGNLIRWGEESARVGPWRADSSAALLVPVPDGGPPSAEFVRRCLRLLAQQGYEKVVTGALAPDEQRGFLEAGFDVQERLHLLLLDRSVPVPSTPPGPAVRRPWGGRRQGALEVDSAAFPPFWRLDGAGLREALEATPRRRFRVVLGGGRRVTGYAICGASGRRGYVQRLAVAPSEQGRGLGRRLLVDGLSWLRSVGTDLIAVNTQKGNEAALHLYRLAGFRDDPDGLCVLTSVVRPLGART